MPWSLRLRWSTRDSWPCSCSFSLVSAAQRSRIAATSSFAGPRPRLARSVSAHSISALAPRPVASIRRVVVSTCAWWLRSSPSRCGLWIAKSTATAVAIRDLLAELAHQLRPLALRELVRQRHLVLARDPRVLALLRFLGDVPQLLALARPVDVALGGLRRQHDLGVLDAALARVVEHLAGRAIGDLRRPSDTPRRRSHCDRPRGTPASRTGGRSPCRHAPLRSALRDRGPGTRASAGRSTRSRKPRCRRRRAHGQRGTSAAGSRGQGGHAGPGRTESRSDS